MKLAELMKTICPWCFRIFTVPDDMDEVRCLACGYIYELPKLVAKNKEKFN